MNENLPSNQKVEVNMEAGRRDPPAGTLLCEVNGPATGMMVPAHPGVLPAPLHYRRLERMRTQALQQGQDYEAQLQVNQNVLVHYTMGPHNRNRCIHQGVGCQEMTTGEPELLQSDFLISGALCCLPDIEVFLRDKMRINVLLRMDNVTLIAFIHRMSGTHSTALSDLVVTFGNGAWRGKSQSTEHLPGTLMYRQTESHPYH